jgi:hypothetical protein
MPETEFNYNLINSLSYHSKGEAADAQFITFRAPSSRNSKECSALKQAFFRALPMEAQTTREVDNPDISGEDVITMIAISDVDLPEMLDIAKRLFTSGNNIALIDGETKLTMNLLDQMSQDDLEGMVGSYMVNFILASSLEKMKKESLKGSQT